MEIPKAEKNPQELEIHNDVRIDNYFWLNQRENPKVMEYLKKENKYTKKQLKPTKDLQKKLVKEMKGRIKKKDVSAPYLFHGYWYISKFKKGKEYSYLYRKKDEKESEYQLLINENKLAENHEYFDLTGTTISPNNQLLAFGIDIIGRRKYTLNIKNVFTGEFLNDTIENCTGEFVFANDNQSIFYVKQEEETLRPYQVYKHIIGQDVNEDILVYTEEDETYNVSIYKSKSQKYIFISSSSSVSDELRFISSDYPNDNFRIIQKREKNLEYTVDHIHDTFFIRTNKDGATNFKLMKTSIEETSQEFWQEVIPHDENTLLEDVELFNNFIVTEQRKNGLVTFNVKSWQKDFCYEIPFNEEDYTAYLSINLECDTTKLRYNYCSLTTPWKIFEFDLETKKQKLIKSEKIPDKSFKESNYLSERLYAKSLDGKDIPISLVYHKNTKISNKTPLLLYGYGSYGISIDSTFSSSRISLLDRGFIFAIAHIRGGEELGRNWYDDGKMLNKKNTFYDFIQCAKFLINNKYTSAQHLYANGGSAGGLLMGAVMNMEPTLFNGVIAQVPFVDVVTTMLDETLPLTTSEYDEWGNPNNKEYYDYIKSYSPYDNIQKIKYPHILITTGFHDSQVQYFEPAKWTAKLREYKTDDNLLLFYTDLKSGHSGKSGRFQALKEYAMEFAFLIMLEQRKKSNK